MILYTAERATQVALDAIQILGKSEPLYTWIGFVIIIGVNDRQI